MIGALLDHLWQSTLFAAGIWLLTLATRNNRAHVRYWLWFSASVKFLIPFSLLMVIGSAFAPAMPLATMSDLHFVQQSARPFTTAAVGIVFPTSPGLGFPALLFLLWLSGFLMTTLVWFGRWLRIRATLRGSIPLAIAAPIAVKSTSTLLGPGLFGIFRPVLLLPDGIAATLTPREMRAVLDHELCHLERHDNLTAAVHMTVEALFWFHPLVWWLGARLITERERACDESVVETGNAAETYAEGIVKVCRFYATSPLTCAPGVSGADLETRLESIMAGRPIAELSGAQKALIKVSAILAVLWPLVGGWTGAIPDKISRAAAYLAIDDATAAGLRRYMTQLQMGNFNAADRLHDSLWNEDTTSRVACENHFRAVLQVLEKGYGRFAPLYPQRARNNQDWLPISLMWKSGLGGSRYQEATVYMSAETAHVWDARRLHDGRYIDAAAVWSAESENTQSVCLTEINIRA